MKFQSIDILPAGCSATIRKDGWTIHSFESSIPIAQLNATVFRRAQNMLLRHIRAAAEPVGVGECCNLTRKLWPEGTLGQNAVLCYEALRGLQDEGKVRTVHVTVPGAPEGGGRIMSTAFRFVKA